MAISWTITVNGVDITSSVISARFSMGRQNPLDDYDANQCSITVRNGTGAFNAGSFPISSFITFTPSTAGGKTRLFWLQTIEYQDEIEAAASTATIVGIDGYGRLGQFDQNIPPVFAFPFSRYTSTGTISQSDDYITAANLLYGFLAIGITTMQTIPPNPSYTPGDSTVPTLGVGGQQTIPTPPGRLLDWINQNMRTERGPWDIPFGGGQGQLWAISRSQFYYQNIGVTIGNVSSSTGILWDQFSRVGLGGNYYNRVTVTGYGGSGTTSIASATPGVTQLGVETRDTNATNATNNSSWLANTLGTPTVLYATVSFLDAIQNTTALTTFLAFKAPVTGWLTVKYQDPGTGIQTRNMALDGMDVEIIPGATRFRAYLSDMTLYSYFTLDDPVFGVLDDDRLGW